MSCLEDDVVPDGRAENDNEDGVADVPAWKCDKLHDRHEVDGYATGPTWPDPRLEKGIQDGDASQNADSDPDVSLHRRRRHRVNHLELDLHTKTFPREWAMFSFDVFSAE